MKKSVLLFVAVVAFTEQATREDSLFCFGTRMSKRL